MGRMKRRLAVTRVGVDGGVDTRAGEVVVEEPLEVRAAGATVVLTGRTPGHDVELAHGYLLAEGMIRGADDVAEARYCGGAIGGENSYNLLDVQLRGHLIAPIPAAACGITAEQRVEDVLHRVLVRPQPQPVEPSEVFALASEIEARRGKVPVAAADDVLREDVSSTNAVAKVVGRLLLDGSVPTHTTLTLDSRVTFPVMRLAAAAGFAQVVTTSDATSLAVDLARGAGIALVGEASETGFALYSGSVAG